MSQSGLYFTIFFFFLLFFPLVDNDLDPQEHLSLQWTHWLADVKQERLKNVSQRKHSKLGYTYKLNSIKFDLIRFKIRFSFIDIVQGTGTKPMKCSLASNQKPA